MATHYGVYKVSAQDATTATLVPDAGTSSVPDYADKISQIVITFTSARDSKEFDTVNRRFALALERR